MATAWHTTIDINGEPYPTRTYAPDAQGSSDDAYDLPPRDLDHVRAVHEAGHAVAALVGGGHLHYARITKGASTSVEGGVTDCCNLTEGEAFAVFCAAGERAVDQWLRKTGLWTPQRAFAAEVSAWSDRNMCLRLNPHVGYGNRQVDYRIVHDLADGLIGRQWTAITTVADGLVRQQRISGDTIADLTRLPNGVHKAN